ncbi:RICIN domain-containing protein [Catenulispora sp. NL8]|uniref:RICIN domain-containing protein n=1 Tax=Catenulispora pinistramenti TaxID=2705254 RepID=A0ABS5KKK8_9ACTN|nr:RICIN domain-containing protein [Catenulispora pinistramenti]MBS2546411.1 RICIN domain-containing protein [Catenulispora pinistramenti]
MISSSLIVAAAVAAVTGAIAAPQTAAAQTAAPQAAPISTIYSAAQNTCLDTSTTDPGHYFLDTYGHPCNGSTAQNFAFQAVSGMPGAYQIVSQANGLCLAKYRLGVRQEACIGSPTWIPQRVGTSGSRYQFIASGTSNTDCIQVYPQPNGYPGPLFDLAACSSTPAQILTLSTTP